MAAATMAAVDDPLCQEPLVSVEFEVFGKVQGEYYRVLRQRKEAHGMLVSRNEKSFNEIAGVYFPKYVRDICLQLKICGWVKNSKTGTILGKMQGPRALVDQMAQWLTSVGSPGSEIHHCEFTNWETVAKQQYQGFVIRF